MFHWQTLKHICTECFKHVPYWPISMKLWLNDAHKFKAECALTQLDTKNT